MGCFHRPFMSCRAGWCWWSPPWTISRRCRSWALMTSSAVAPWWPRSQGPPSCLHVIVFIGRFLSLELFQFDRPAVRWDRHPRLGRFRPIVVSPGSAGGLLGRGVEPVEQVGGRYPQDQAGHLFLVEVLGRLVPHLIGDRVGMVGQ